MVLLRRCLTAMLFSVALLNANSQARFDLPGPKIDIRVTRAGILLPIATVPNLQPGDQLWLHPDFPPSQSAHYLLIVAFLRGTTNPPPDNWFLRIETWDKKVREEGSTVTVPEEAQQAILFLAPETGGDFATLRSTVKGHPGIFVRASQDLNEAGFEQGRIDKYLDAMKQVPPGDAKALQEHSDLLARTLALKPNPDCFKRPLDQQYTCLTQTGSQSLLDDGHAQSVAEALSNGPSSDFINAASYTNLAGGGLYSAYVGAIVDLVRLTSGLHTAKYQYIPAIAYPAHDLATPTLDLRLNSAPSFNNPKSVIVIGLPAVQQAIPPPLRPVDAKHISCLLDPHLALPIEGAPLVFSTAFAHDLVLHLNTPTKTPDFPLTPDPYQGGLVLKTGAGARRELTPSAQKPAAEPEPAPAPQPASGEPITGTIQGMWGFDHFTGPTVSLQQFPGSGWRIVPQAGGQTSGQTSGQTNPKPEGKPDASADTLIVGQPNHLKLEASGTACIKSIALEPTDTRLDWKLAGDPHHPDEKTDAKADAKPAPKPDVPPTDPKSPAKPQPVEVTLNLTHDTPPGGIHLAILQYGQSDPDMVGATAFVEPARIDGLQLHAGDTTAVLSGTSLDQVKSVTLKDLTYSPESSSSDKTLNLKLPDDAKAPALKPNDHLTAEIHLRDGRTLPVAAVVLTARPAVTILSRKIAKAPTSSIALTKPDDLALGSELDFFLKSKAPFPRTDKIEIAAVPAPDLPDQADALHTTLSVATNSLVLQDAHTILVNFDPLKTFGASTYGPFRLRPVAADGTAGEWVPLATIVRLPTLTTLTCPIDPTANCTLAGTALYLIDSIALDAAFTAPTKVPEGFVDTTISIQHPNGTPAVFYLRLRDDPATAQQVTMTAQYDAPPPPIPMRHGAKTTPAPAAPSPAPTATPPPVIQPQSPAPATPAPATPPTN